MFGFDREKWKKLNGLNTATEISQQPELWRETIDIIENQKKKVEDFIESRLGKENIRVIFTGAGTSAYVGEIVAPYLNSGKNYIYEAIATTDIVSNPATYFKKYIPTLLVSFSRSGNSPESVAVYDLANDLIEDVSHIFITCNNEGKLAEISRDEGNVLLLLMPEKSNDKGFAMTSSFSCMGLTALLIFDMQNYKINKEQASEMISIGMDIIESKYGVLNKLIDYDFERIVYLGSGIFHGLSKESALKLLELTRGQITSFSETTLGFRHGPKSILNDKTLVFMFLSHDEYARKYDLDLLNEIYHDIGGHKVISISNKYGEEIEKISDHHIYLTKDNNNITNEFFISLLYVLFAQIFALKSSVKSKVEPDNPNPSGLVNRVVQGVTVHKYK